MGKRAQREYKIDNFIHARVPVDEVKIDPPLTKEEKLDYVKTVKYCDEFLAKHGYEPSFYIPHDAFDDDDD